MTEPESTQEFSVTHHLQDLATVIGFGVLGWALCGFVVWIGGQFFSMNTTLLLHAALVIERNFNMFKSVIGTWVPFALILVTTYLSGVCARRRRDTA